MMKFGKALRRASHKPRIYSCGVRNAKNGHTTSRFDSNEEKSTYIQAELVRIVPVDLKAITLAIT